MKFASKKASFYGGIVLIFVLFAGLVLVNKISADIWADEACTLATVESSWAYTTYATAIDVHPPLYYYIVKIVYNILGIKDVDIVGRICIGRIISLLPLLLIFVVCIIASKKTKTKNCILIYPFLLCQYFPIVQFSCEMRMYSWALLFVTIAGISVLFVGNARGRYWITLICSSLCVCYIHYFAVLPVIIMWMLLGATHIRDKRFIKKFFFAGICVIIGYIPWLITFVRQFNSVHDNYWIPETNLAAIKAINEFILSSDKKVRILFYLIFLMVLFYSFKNMKSHRRYSIWMLGMMFMPWVIILVSIVISELYRPILIDRYIVPTLGIMGLGELLLLLKMFDDNKVMKYMAAFFCVMAVVLSIYNTFECFQTERQYGVDWDRMMADISGNDGDTFLYIENGQPLVRPLTMMFPDAVHICDNANMTEYNQLLFKTKNYANQDLEEPLFVVTASSYQINKENMGDYLGTYITGNGEYNIYYFKEGIKAGSL